VDPLNQPEYRRIADDLRQTIASGKYGPGEQLSSISALRSRYGVSLATVRSAIGVLEREGLVVSRQGRGTFVVDKLPPIEQSLSARVEAVENELRELRRLVTGEPASRD
jgi:DNA-binding GntR family transcriptional regulator